MRRGGGGRQEYRPAESKISASITPIQDHDHDHDHDLAQESESPSLALPSTSQPQNLEPTIHRNPMSGSRNRRAHAGKPRFVKKAEVGSLNCEVGSLSLGERVDGQLEIEGEEGRGKGRDEEGSGSKNEVSESSKDENDVVGRLEELILSGEEPDLLDEQLKTNDQSQEDELLAMESIYGDNVIILDRQRDLRSFQIHIHIEAPNGITVTTKLNSSGDPKSVSNNTDDFTYSFEVQYLPPIVLTCLLPKSYPSHLPPYFTLSVHWLDSIKVSNLCSKLDAIWMEQQGQEVLYQWVEWLTSSSLSSLGFDKEIILGPYGMRHVGDRRAVSRSVSPDDDVPFIRSYNDKRLLENFLQNLHECFICLSEYAGTEFIRLPCHHFLCWTCMKTYSNMHVSEGTVNKLQCPNPTCGVMIPPSLLKLLLSHEEYERWESLTLQKTLDSMSDIVYCPRCEMPCIEDEDQHAQCSKCFFSFCTLCEERRHVGVECMTPEMKLKFLQDRQSSSQLKGEQKRKEREMINELLSVKEILRDAKQCPSCKMAISKTEGCNKMVCNNCGQFFCYRCNKAIDGYDHFGEGTCDLFPQEMIQQWEERINPRQVLGQIQAELFGQQGQGQLCPNCRQFNAKVGNNNHLFCWACQVHYCYLCRNIVRRSSEHFGRKGCKQHTAD
ncbi:hypothetical protein UlMin_001197 [Ulmus minor]